MADLNEMTKEELLEEAKRLDIEGRSTMNKDELLAAVQQAQGETTANEDPDREAKEEQQLAGPAVQAPADRPQAGQAEQAPDPYAPTPGGDQVEQPQTVPTEGTTYQDPGLQRMAEQTEAVQAQPNVAQEPTVP